MFQFWKETFLLFGSMFVFFSPLLLFLPSQLFLWLLSFLSLFFFLLLSFLLLLAAALVFDLLSAIVWSCGNGLLLSKSTGSSAFFGRLFLQHKHSWDNYYSFIYNIRIDRIVVFKTRLAIVSWQMKRRCTLTTHTNTPTYICFCLLSLLHTHTQYLMNRMVQTAMLM